MISRSAGIFKLPTGANVAYQRWGNTNTNTLHIKDSKRILALHGWLDNSNSFSKLGSYLGTNGFDFVAIDLPGHGLSSHLDTGIHYFPFCVETVRLILDSLGWSSSKSNIVGHSMGAGISMIFNGCYPELVSKSVLIDQIAPLMTSPSSSASKLRKAIDARLAVYAKPSNIKEYPTFDDTISARLRSLSMWPGQQTLSVDAATTIMERGVVSIQNTNDQVDIGTMAHSSFVKAGPVVFRHDPKLTLPSYTYFSEDQVML
jgi:pimeloyl-ACP methyl ester carboxylesterase